ncbi:MAG: phosphoadenosine phosphosulfate reductase family protein [Oscillospiraceae bacterium]|jgi:phosphoadenosine phosphosulfate reductase|nr:phosphoadenosine phosphosulfate reductase family protein [Oscillospiraceae bacterium]
MALIEDTMFGRTDKVQTAIEQIRLYDPTLYGNEQYTVGYSGGKDSDVIRILTDLAGVPHSLLHNHTTIDAPETVRYVRSIPNVEISMPKRSMWKLIVYHKMPPTRVSRYCCSELKEKTHKGMTLITGVRWSESNKRKNGRGAVELRGSSKAIILGNDNDENRRNFETCYRRQSRTINPIIDWNEADVWEFLRYYGCNSNPLYQCGYKRIGCIGCPLAGEKSMRRDFERYPKYKNAFVLAFGKMLDELFAKEVKTKNERWTSGEAVMGWWLDDSYKTRKEKDDMQLSMFDEKENPGNDTN